MQEKRHDRVVEMRLCFFLGKVGDYNVSFVETRMCRSTANLEKQLEEGAIYGEHYAEHFIPTIEVLKFIIERLEGLQNGN